MADLSDELNNVIGNNEFDSAVLGSEFLKLFPTGREEDVSDKLAWFLKFGFIRDPELKEQVTNKLLDLIRANLRFEHNKKHSYRSDFSIGSHYEVSREYYYEENKHRLDVLLTQEGPISHAIGIEVKVGDKSFLKSNTDFELLKKRYNQVEFWMILPNDDYETYLNTIQNNDEDLEKTDAESCSDLSTLDFPIITWEALCKTLRQLLLFFEQDKTMSLHVFTELFIGAIEISVLKIQPENISSILQKKGNHRIWETLAIKEYLKFRLLTSGN